MRHKDGVEWGSSHTLCLCSAGFVGKERNSFSRAVIQAPFISSILMYMHLNMNFKRSQKQRESRDLLAKHKVPDSFLGNSSKSG